MRKKVFAVVFLLTLTGMTGLFAIDIVLNPPPKIIIDPSNQFADVIRDLLRSQGLQGLIDGNFNEDDLWSMIGGADPDLQKQIGAVRDLYPRAMVSAFADTSVFASTGASLRGYQGYSAFALTVGAVAGIQLPLNIFSLFGNEGFENAMDKLVNDIENDHDLRVGLNPQILNAQLGINTRFLKGLYIGVKGGWMNLDLNQLSIPLPDQLSMSFQTMSIGPMINYQLIRQVRLLGGLILWRGLNLGTGFIYQKTSLDFSMPLPVNEEDLRFDIWQAPAELGLGTGKITGEISNPKIKFDFTVNTYTVPLEAVTSIRLLGFFNASIGVGADLGFGDASLGGSLDAGVKINIDPILTQQLGLRVEPGSFLVTIGGENSPTLFNPKIMGSIGFSVGPAIILDIPITYYFQNNGFNVGVTLGIAL